MYANTSGTAEVVPMGTGPRVSSAPTWLGNDGKPIGAQKLFMHIGDIVPRGRYQVVLWIWAAMVAGMLLARATHWV